MLIRFNVKNFLSFNTREDGKSQEFSMIAGKVRSKKEHLEDDGNLKLLKFAAVYGANASGKSNLVKAMDFMKRTIVAGTLDRSSDKYCKVNSESKDQASYFEVELKLNEKYYAYGFEAVLSRGEFISEWLVELKSDNKEKLIFSRDIVKGQYSFGHDFNTEKLLARLNVYADDIKSDSSALFLTIMNQNKGTLYQTNSSALILRDAYQWIQNSWDINYPDRTLSNYSYMANKDNLDDVCSMIEAFGTGITGFEIVPVPLDKVMSKMPINIAEEIADEFEKRMKNPAAGFTEYRKGFLMRSNSDFFILKLVGDELTCETIRFKHSTNALFDLAEESDGTLRILDLLEILLSDAGKTYVIDELDRCLHPSLTYKFVELFLKLAEKKSIQLIVTTHESRLMDFDLLRRDEIWFVNKRKNGESDIYSLEEYNARFDQKIDKAYLEGRYGGVPVFSSVFPIDEV